MSNNLVQQLMANASPSLAVLGSANTFPIKEIKLPNGKKTAFFQSQLVSDNQVGLAHQIKDDIVVNPVTSISTTDIENAAQVDLRMQSPGDEVMINGLKLKIVVTNSDTGNQSAVPAPLLIGDIRIFFNDSNSEVYTIQGHTLYHQAFVATSNSDLVPLAVVNNASATTWHGAGNLATTASDTFYVNIPGPWSYQPMWGGLFRSMTIRVTFAGATNGLVTTGNNDGVYQLTSLNARAEYFQISQREAMNIRDAFQKAGGVSIRFLAPVYERQSQALANSTTYTLNLNAIKGLMAEVDFYFRTSLAGASNGATSFTELVSSYEFQDENGNSLSAGNTFDSDWNLRVSAARNFDSAFLNTKAMYTHCFVNAGHHGVQAAGGQVLGGMYMNRNRLRFTTNTSAGGSTYYIDIVGMAYNLLNFGVDGQVSVTRS